MADNQEMKELISAFFEGNDEVDFSPVCSVPNGGESTDVAANNPVPTSHSPNNSEVMLQILTQDIEPTSDLSFKGPITKSLLMMILKVLVIQHNRDFCQEVILQYFSKPQICALKYFVKKNARNFFFGRNQLKPIYSLRTDSLGSFIQDRYTGLPVVVHHSYMKSSKDLIESREVICLENVKDVLTDLHCTKGIDGSKCCVPGGINALSKTFNRTFFYKGIFKEIRSFLKDCESCRVNIALPLTQMAPPQPIRSFHPHQRIQYDLIDMAPRKREYMKDNPWGFRYILSIKCCFSKFCWLFPLQRKTAPMVHRVIKFLFDVEGAPDILQSDNGKEFVNSLIKQLSNDYGFRMVRGKPYTPRHQGQVENLNKTVKAFLRRLLQGASEKEQGRIWPLLLPGIADKINKSYHFTIDDIPFRVYRNRDCSNLGFTIVPEDSIIKSSTASSDSSSDDESEESSYLVDGHTDSGEEETSLEKEPFDCSATYDASSQKTISDTEIMQSCLGSSLSKSFFVDRVEEDNKLDSISIEKDEEEEIFNEEIEVTSRVFSSCLFNISKSRYLTHLKILESTEMTIHQNIERDLKNCVSDKFSVGDKVLVKNPDLCSGLGIGGRYDPFQPLNVIAEVVEVLPSSMYKLKLSNSEGFYQKSVFQGEMVLFKANEDTSSTVPDSIHGIAKRTKKAVLEAISDFGLQFRRRIYKEKSAHAKAPQSDVKTCFANLFSCLDFGVLAELYGSCNTAQQRSMHSSFLHGLDELKQAGFPFFLYGSVAWERKRKVWLSDKFLVFLEEDSPHQCIDCFIDRSSSCSHYCCRQLAQNFLERCGLKTPQLTKSGASTAQSNKRKQRIPSNSSGQRSKRPKTSLSSAGISDETPQLGMQTQSTLISTAEEKCDTLLLSGITNSTRQLLEKFKLKVAQHNKGGASKNLGKFERNVRYFLDVTFSTYPIELTKCVTIVAFRCDKDLLQIQMQGENTALCGMCALHNTIDQFSLSPLDFNEVADNLWLEMALKEDLGNDLERLRSRFGDYSIDVIVTVAQYNGYDCMRLDNEFIKFFSHADPDSLDEDPKNLYQAFLHSLNFKENERIFLADSMNHYVTVIFREGDILILDSIKGPTVYSIESGVTYLWQLSYSPGFAAYLISKKISVSIQNDKESVVDDGLDIFPVFGHVNAHDLSSLDGNNYINDAVIAAVCQAINNNFSTVFAVDPLVASRIANACSTVADVGAASRSFSLQRDRERILFPINCHKHWWVLTVDLASCSYSVLDSQRLHHNEEVMVLLAILQSNGCTDACKYKQKSICFPQQRSDGTHCGVFAICAMICVANQIPFDFSLYDMDHVRERLAHNIFNDLVDRVTSPAMWKDDIDDQSLADYFQQLGSHKLEMEEDALARKYGNHIVLLYMNSPVKRYIYEEGKNGKVFRMGRYYMVCDDDELQLYQNWKDMIDAGKHCYEELTPPFRRYLKEFPAKEDEIHYVGERWVKLTHDHISEYNDWHEQFVSSIDDKA